MKNSVEWNRIDHDKTFLRCLDDEATRAVWYERIASVIDALGASNEFQINDNGYRRFPSVLVTEGVKGTFKGNDFAIWSDHPGEILLIHPDVPRSSVELLCNRVRESWLTANELSHQEGRHGQT